MVSSDGELLPPSVIRQMGDKLYDRRKVAALEVEQIVKRLASQNDQKRIHDIVAKVIDYFFSAQANYRKGALLCLAAAAVGLTEPNEQHLRQIVPPVLTAFVDQDSRVRYYACEALYNIAKVSREPFIIFFNETFDACFRLCADTDTQVQNAVQFLDNLVKDIITASPNFKIEQFVPKLRDYMRVVNPHKRQFLISWITVLDSVPDLDMLAYLPELLDGLMNMLSDQAREIRVAAHKAMMEFLVEIQADQKIELSSMATILVEKADAQDELTRQTALKWLKEFVEMAPLQLLDHYPGMLGVVLPNISHTNAEIKQVAAEANAALLRLPSIENGGRVDTSAVLETVSRELRSEQEPTRLEAIRWLHFLLTRSPEDVLGQMTTLLPALLEALSAPSDKVVMESLAVLAAIADHRDQFRPVLQALLNRFRGDAGGSHLQRGGSLVIRRLCAHMGSERVYRELAGILDDETDLAFARHMVQALTLILLSSPEVRPLRDLLREVRASPQGAALFAHLYPSWSHSAGAVLSLCFLAGAHQHACDVVGCFATLEIGAEVLVQVDRLVSLLETPAYTFLRLQLLQPQRHPSLLRAMHSILALLPQGTAFRTLSARLEGANALTMLQLDPHKSGKAPQEVADNWADFPTLLKTFMSRQQVHAAAEERQRGIQEGWLKEKPQEDTPTDNPSAPAPAAAPAAAPSPDTPAQEL